jgi:hypothetical protein
MFRRNTLSWQKRLVANKLCDGLAYAGLVCNVAFQQISPALRGQFRNLCY